MGQPETEPVATVDQWIVKLDEVALRLRAAHADAPGAHAETADQVAAETAIAHVLALIGGPKVLTPTDLTDPTDLADGAGVADGADRGRPIAAGDLLITVDLVRKNAKSEAITSSDVVDAPDFGC